MPKIALTEVESSQIHAIGHAPETNTLAVQFKSKGGPGNVYHYANVDAEKFGRFRNADSIGRFFGAEIKPYVDAHPFTKIEPEKTEESEGADGIGQ